MQHQSRHTQQQLEQSNQQLDARVQHLEVTNQQLDSKVQHLSILNQKYEHEFGNVYLNSINSAVKTNI